MRGAWTKEDILCRCTLDPETGCWIWNGKPDRDGYGRIGWERAHRVAFELWNGPIPDGMLVLHTCDRPPCVRPDDLFTGTDRDNAHDRMLKGRNGNAPLQLPTLQAITELKGTLSQRQIAVKFGISNATVHRVHHQEFYKRFFAGLLER